MSRKTESRAGNVQAEQGIVIIDGPDAIALSMTPKAASKMGQRMIDAASAAKAQPKFKEKRRRP
ncbi:hypothetical protein BH09PSE3_BH09PSE3_05080 [soil metagenome]